MIEVAKLVLNILQLVSILIAVAHASRGRFDMATFNVSLAIMLNLLAGGIMSDVDLIVAILLGVLLGYMLFGK